MIARPELPAHITRTQVLSVLDLLGLPRNCRSLTIDGVDGAKLTMYARDADTNHMLASGDEPITITAQIPFGPEEVNSASSDD